jgi:hypothetical protein
MENPFSSRDAPSATATREENITITASAKNNTPQSKQIRLFVPYKINMPLVY